METLPLIDDGKTHIVHLGETFKKNSHAAFHTVRLDFKPASVDVNQPGKVVVTDKHQVEIVLPHQQNSKNANTVYRGSTKAVQKECVLIIDPQTGNLTLERINSQIQAKKIRLAPGSSHLTSTNIPPPTQQPQPPQLSNNQMVKKPKSIQGKKPTQPQTIKLPTKVINPSPTSAFVPATHKSHDMLQMPTSRIEDYVKDVEEEDGGELQPDELLENIANLSDSGSDSSSSSSSSSSDSDDDDGITSPMTPNVPETPPVKTNENLLDLDLELTSSSGSDSN